jgi:hypothetical protein
MQCGIEIGQNLQFKLHKALLVYTLAAHKQWDEALVHHRLAQTDLLAQRPDLQGEELEPGILTGLKSTASHP